MVINLARWMELEDFVCFLRDIAWPCTLGGLEFFGLFDEMEGVEGEECIGYRRCGVKS